MPLQSNSGPHPMAPNSKNDDDYEFARPRSTWKPNFAQIGGFLYFGGHFGFNMASIANQNGRHMVQHVLLPVNIHFHWNLFHFWIFSNLFWFYIGRRFEMVAILKILKTKSTTLSDDLFLCQVLKGSAVGSEFNIVCTLVTMATAANLNFFNPPKATTHYGGYSYKVSWSLMKGIQNIFKSPLFCFHGNCSKVCPTDPDFFGLSRSTRYGCCSYQV